MIRCPFHRSGNWFDRRSHRWWLLSTTCSEISYHLRRLRLFDQVPLLFTLFSGWFAQLSGHRPWNFLSGGGQWLLCWPHEGALPFTKCQVSKSHYFPRRCHPSASHSHMRAQPFQAKDTSRCPHLNRIAPSHKRMHLPVYDRYAHVLSWSFYWHTPSCICRLWRGVPSSPCMLTQVWSLTGSVLWNVWCDIPWFNSLHSKTEWRVRHVTRTNW